MGGPTHSSSPTLHTHPPQPQPSWEQCQQKAWAHPWSPRAVPQPLPLLVKPPGIPALLQSVVSVLVRRVGDISKQCLLALYSFLPRVLGWRLPSGPGGRVVKVRPGVSSRGSVASL